MDFCEEIDAKYLENGATIRELLNEDSGSLPGFGKFATVKQKQGERSQGESIEAYNCYLKSIAKSV